MNNKRTFIIVGILAGLIALVWCGVAVFAFNKWRSANQGTDMPVTNITACDVDASSLCVVSFGVDNVNRMVINFQLSTASYAAFYIKAHYGTATVSVYPCQVVAAAPTSVFCTGARTPLGEAIILEAYSTDGDILLARGTLMVSAIALPTTVNVTMTPTGGTGTPSVTQTEIFTTVPPATGPADSTQTMTPTIPTPTIQPTSTPTVGGYP
jgi:hypothetical protein